MSAAKYTVHHNQGKAHVKYGRYTGRDLELVTQSFLGHCKEWREWWWHLNRHIDVKAESL